MIGEEMLNIKLTEEEHIKHECALMMAASDPWVTMGIDYNGCLHAFDGAYKEIYVAEFENGIAGFVILQTCGTFKGYIQTICVGEKYRGRGFGNLILRFCEKRILEISPNIFICVSSFNTRALQLYQSFGFTLVGELPDFVKTGFTELLLRKTVGPMLGYPAEKGS